MSNRNSLEWLKVKDVAAQLDITTMSVYRLISAGKLPATRATPRSVRIRRADLEAYLAQASSCQPAAPQDPWDEYLASTRYAVPYIHADAEMAADVTPDDLLEAGGAHHVYVLSFPDGELYAMFPADTDPAGLDAAWASCKKLGGHLQLNRVEGQP